MIAVELWLSILGVLLTVLGWLLAVLGALVLLLLLVPTQARVRGRVRLEDGAEDVLEGAFRVAWGGGLLGLSGSLREGIWLRGLGLRLKRLRPGRGAAKDEAPGKEKPRKKKAGGRSGAWAWRHRGALYRAGRLLLGTLHLEGELEGVLGLADPADTARAEGLLRALRAAGLETDVACDYLDERFDLAGELRLRVWPVETLVVALGLLFRAELRAALRDKA